jgi:glycosyltransferase involved in cell wall biosynthesis
MATQSPAVRSLLLVRNGVDHDARVLRAARVAQRTLPGGALVLGVATATAPAGTAVIEGVQVLRLPARPPGLTRLARRLSGAPRRAAVARSGTSGSPRGPAAAQLVSATVVAAAAAPMTLRGRTRRILSGLSFSRQALAVAHQTRPRLVHANDWNTMWTGLAIKLGYGARLVYDSHELWPDRNGRWEWRPWLLAGEALFMHAADEVITSSPGYADTLARRYRVPRPLVVRNIPERSSRPDAAPASRARRVRVSANTGSRIAGPPSPPRVVYIGGLMPGRGLEQMIDSLPLLPDVRLYAIGPGTGPYRMALLARARAARVEDRVVLRAPVAPGEVQGALAGAAAGLCLIQPICRSYELSLPNKLFEYAAAGVPVLASDAPVIAAVVRAHGLGQVVAADRPRAIATSLDRLLAPEGWRLASERASAFAAGNDWPEEADTLARVYGRVAGASS